MARTQHNTNTNTDTAWIGTQHHTAWHGYGYGMTARTRHGYGHGMDTNMAQHGHSTTWTQHSMDTAHIFVLCPTITG